MDAAEEKYNKGEKCRNDQEEHHNNNYEGIKKIFVTRLSHTVRTSELRKLFRQFGRVINVYIPRKAVTYLRQGYAFITFETSEDARKAIEHHKILVLHGRKLIVRPADEKHQLPLINESLVKQNDESYSAPATSLDTDESKDDDSKDDESEDDDDDYDDDTGITKCKIAVLNDDCLLHIFSFLPKREVIKLERVSRWWQSVSLEFWHSVKKLELCEFHAPPGCQEVLTICMLDSILRRCGTYLKSLDVTSGLNAFGSNALRVIGKYCDKLESLSIGYISPRIHDLKYLFNVATKFKNLNLVECSGKERYIARLLNKCQNLQSLDIHNCKFFSGKCLKSLNTKKLFKLHIEKCRYVSMDHLVTSFHRMETLRSLTLDLPAECIVTRKDYMRVVEALPQLEYLTFPRCAFLNGYGVMSFATLTNITSLNVHSNAFINNSVLQGIADNCLKLKALNIAGCNFSESENMLITDVGVQAVARLPQLEVLVLNNLEFITDESLNSLAHRGKLRHLEVRGNTAITDSGCNKLIVLCECLELLDVSGCCLITDVTAETAATAVKARTNNLSLRLVVGGTTISETWKDATPLLQIDFMDYSSRHYNLYLFDDLNLFFPNEYSDSSDEDSDSSIEIFYNDVPGLEKELVDSDSSAD